MKGRLGLIAIIIFSVFTSCIPLRKQLFLIDKSKKDLAAIQRTDTILFTKPFEYKLRNGDNITIKVSNLQFDAVGGFESILKSKNSAPMNATAQSTGPGEDGYQINDSGYVNLPFLGSIKMAGLSMEEAESKINKLASKYFNHTITNIKVGFSYTIVLINNGFLKNSNTTKLTLIEAIAQSTIPDYANLRKIKIIRRLDNNAGLHIYYVDINDQSIVSKPEFYILPNDIIILEASRIKNFNQYFVRNYGLVSTFISLPLLFFSLLTTFRRI